MPITEPRPPKSESPPMTQIATANSSMKSCGLVIAVLEPRDAEEPGGGGEDRARA